MSSTALIIGGSGQTGAYLAHRLLQQGQSVTAASRDADTTSWWRFDTLGISQSVETMTLDPASAASISGALERYQPDSIYYLAGPSSVAQSFESPAEVFRDITQPIITILDVLANAGY